MRFFRDWIVAVSGAIMIVVGLTAYGVRSLHTYAILGIVVGILVMLAWLIAFTMWTISSLSDKIDDDDRNQAVGQVEKAKAEFMQFAEAAKLSGAVGVDPWIAYATSEFDKLRQVAATSKTADLEDPPLDAKFLQAFRAKFALESELNVLTYEAMSDLAEWGVPAAIRTDYETKVLAAKTVSVETWREWVGMLLRQRVAWDDYVSWFNGFLGRVTFLLVVVLLAAMIEGLLQLVLGMTVLGLLFMGTAGAIVSILFALPRVSSYEEVNAWIFHLVSRIITGIAGSFVGWGLLATGVVTFAIGKTNINELLAACRGGCAPPNLLMLGAIGMLLGFSERLLPDLESRFFNSTAKPASATSVAPPPPSPPPAANSAKP